MRKTTWHRGAPRSARLALVALAAWALASAPGRGERKTENRNADTRTMKWTGAGADPRGFASAEEMYKVAPEQPFDAAAADRLAVLSDLLLDDGTWRAALETRGWTLRDGRILSARLLGLARGSEVWNADPGRGLKGVVPDYAWRDMGSLQARLQRVTDDQIYRVSAAALSTNDQMLIARLLRHAHARSGSRMWVLLDEMNPYRNAPEAQSFVTNAAASLAARISIRTNSSSVTGLMAQAELAYRDGRLPDAIRFYREAVAACPDHRDAWNNLALAQLHLGQDLPARFNLEVVRRLDTNYLPAMINLAVVDERGGRRAQAEAIAQAALNIGTDVPPAVYNAAWFRDVNGDHAQAAALLAPFASIAGMRPEFYTLRRLSERQANDAGAPPAEPGKMLREPARKPWQSGLAGLAGARTTKLRRTIAVVVFLVVSLIVLSSIGPAIKRDLQKASFLRACILYLVYWGVPANAVGWVLAVVYVLFMMVT